MSYEPVTSDPVEKVVSNALSKAFPNRAVTIDIVLAIINALIPIVTGCFGRSAKHAIRKGSTNALSASYQAALASGYSPKEAITVALHMRAEGMDAPDSDINDFVDNCKEFQSRSIE